LSARHPGLVFGYYGIHSPIGSIGQGRSRGWYLSRNGGERGARRLNNLK
jgi:hypothetical protein